jgi:hypothetical protein
VYRSMRGAKSRGNAVSGVVTRQTSLSGSRNDETARSGERTWSELGVTLFPSLAT